MPKKFLGMCNGVCMRSHASYDEAWISYIYYLTYYLKKERLYQISSWDKSLLYNSIVSKWHQSLDDKSVCNVYSLRVKFNIDLSFSEITKLYSIKFFLKKT